MRPKLRRRRPQIHVLLRGNRLQITADVDAAGVAKLKDVLSKYEGVPKTFEMKEAAN